MLVARSEMSCISRKRPNRFRRSTSINTSDQRRSGNCCTTSSSEQSGLVLTTSRIRSPIASSDSIYTLPFHRHSYRVSTKGEGCTQVLVQGRFAGLVERYLKLTAFNTAATQDMASCRWTFERRPFRTVRIERKRSVCPIVPARQTPY